jgi:DNA-binding XRE family transcriptional regulator
MDGGFEVLAPRLQAKREEKGVTRHELALMVGVPSDELGAIEAGGRVRYDDDHLCAQLMRALDVEFEELFDVCGRDRFGRRLPTALRRAAAHATAPQKASQYSSGRRIVVTLRSASVMIQRRSGGCP